MGRMIGQVQHLEHHGNKPARIRAAKGDGTNLSRFSGRYPFAGGSGPSGGAVAAEGGSGEAGSNDGTKGTS